MEKKRSFWSRAFVLPAVPTILIMILAAALLVFAFHKGWYDMRGAGIYIFSTYALILACTGYARLMERWPVLKKIFTLPLLPSLVIIIIGAALLIYMFTMDDFGWIAWIGYPLSAYAFVLAITSFIRMLRQLSTSDYEVRVGGNNKQLAVRSKAVSGFLSGMLIPFFQVVTVSFGYVMMKTAKGIKTGSAGSILLAILTVIATLAMLVLGPLFFLIGIACIFWWSSHIVRGIVLCAIGLILILLVSRILLRMMEKQKAELARGI